MYFKLIVILIFHTFSYILSFNPQDGWTGFGTIRIKKKLKAVDFHCGYLLENPDPRFKTVDNGIKFNLDLLSPRPLHSDTIPVDVREGWFTDLKVGHGG